MDNKGFTIVELAVVVGAIAILVTIAFMTVNSLPKLDEGGISAKGAVESVEQSTRKHFDGVTTIDELRY